MKPFLGLVSAAVTSAPSRRGPRRIRSASSSGSSGMPVNHHHGRFGKNQGWKKQIQMPPFDKLTEKSQEALQAAASLAADLGQQAVEPEHLALSLLRQEGGLTRPLLEGAGVSLPALEAALVSDVERFPRVSGGQPFIANSLSQALDRAEREADRLKDEYVSTEHLLLALAELGQFKDAGVSRDSLLQALRRVRGSQ